MSFSIYIYLLSVASINQQQPSSTRKQLSTTKYVNTIGGSTGLRDESPRPSPQWRGPQIGDKSGTAIGHFDSASGHRHQDSKSYEEIRATRDN